MVEGSELPTTQRAYTLRLRGMDRDDMGWKNAVWATHEAVNKGAKAFGDWLLTMRGGLDHNLANTPVKKGNGNRPPTPQERRDRRILLALSWLSVEDEHGAPKDNNLIETKGTDNVETRERCLRDALLEILMARGVAAIELGDVEKRPNEQPFTWLGDCMPSLSSAIREDAVWVNRSKAFQRAREDGVVVSDSDIWDFLNPFFSSPEAYLQPAKKALEDDDSEGTPTNNEKAKDLVQKAGGWLSKRMGTGRGADFQILSDAYQAISIWATNTRGGHAGTDALADLAQYLSDTGFRPSGDSADGILSVISGPGYKSATRNYIGTVNDLSVVEQEHLNNLAETARIDAENSISKIGDKGPRPYSSEVLAKVEEACGFTYRTDTNGENVPAKNYAQFPDDYKWGPARHVEFSVMLDHAARRVSIAHSWIKNAEAERRQFEGDSSRLVEVSHDAREWLRTYCEDRGTRSGSLGVYRIRKRAIDGWEKVVTRWSRSDCRSVDDRVAAARSLQDDPEIGKFGDIQLFEALATDDALCVWKPEGEADPEPLKDYVAATDAEDKRRRFKVPAYRHPDALRHPVFTDFGKSRWKIDYSAHRASSRQSQLKSNKEKLAKALANAEKKLETASDKHRSSQQDKVDLARQKLHLAQQQLDDISDPQRLTLGLWNGQSVAPSPLKWSCKRLISDLALRPSKNIHDNGEPVVSRADRFGRAAAGVNGSVSVSLSNLFDQNDWNGRLQAPRAQLDTIARYVDKHGWDEKARMLTNQIRWLITFSAELSQLGPWNDYCQRFSDEATSKAVITRRGDNVVVHDDNKQRKGLAKLALSRLPGLRVLSVDLGHRYAAACTVWETISGEQMVQACREAEKGLPPSDSMFIEVEGKSTSGKHTKTIYRRIGSDELADGSIHPAPWARLDRQFLIKLQGEDRQTRKASPNELAAVVQFEKWLGQTPFDKDPERDLSIDALMSDTVRTARLALARHGRRARIAYHLTATDRIQPGGRKIQLDDTGRIDLLVDTLADWHALAIDGRWDDPLARQLWNEQFTNQHGGFPIEKLQVRSLLVEEQPSKQQRKQDEQHLRERLHPLAESLAGNESFREMLHVAWATRWKNDDEQWKKQIRWLSDWLMPRGLGRLEKKVTKSGKTVTRRKSNRSGIAMASNVGGLSLTRITTLTEFRRRVQVSYFTRLHPKPLDEKGKLSEELGPQFGQSTLDAIQKLKDQRIKQLASRIVEAALGIGIEQNGRSNGSAKHRDPKRPCQSINDPRFAPCHAVVIEDLTHYRPEQTRTRRENRATMDWKSAETRKRLADHCQLYGLLLRDVNPQYTSRQDSRTGAPGTRCIDVSINDFLTRPMWRKQVAQAKRKADENKGTARDRYLLELETWSTKTPVNQRDRATPLRIPLTGGEIFVSADHRSPLSAGLQADLNAAANIGLRALMDPDFEGRWWYVPVVLTDDGYRIPNSEKCLGAECLDGWKVAKSPNGYSPDGTPVRLADETDIQKAKAAYDEADQILKAANKELKQAKKIKEASLIDQATQNVDRLKSTKQEAKKALVEAKKASKSKQHLNLWRDPSAESLASAGWAEYSEFMQKVEFRVIQILRRRTGFTDKQNESSPRQ